MLKSIFGHFMAEYILKLLKVMPNPDKPELNIDD